DRRIRREPCHRELVDVARERAVLQQIARDVVEPETLALVVERSVGVHAVISCDRCRVTIVTGRARQEGDGDMARNAPMRGSRNLQSAAPKRPIPPGTMVAPCTHARTLPPIGTRWVQ